MGYLITETTETGQLVKDYIWQEGMTPLAQIDNNTTESIVYLYTDHLMTNRLATNDLQQVIWQWEGEAFGNTPAEELTATKVNLRFPGQYFDEETNLHYNHFRYYDPALGRYITSDPIGLKAGLNSYVYVEGNALSLIDPYGLVGKSRNQKLMESTSSLLPTTPQPAPGESGYSDCVAGWISWYYWECTNDNSDSERECRATWDEKIYFRSTEIEKPPLGKGFDCKIFDQSGKEFTLCPLKGNSQTQQYRPDSGWGKRDKYHQGM